MSRMDDTDLGQVECARGSRDEPGGRTPWLDER